MKKKWIIRIFSLLLTFCLSISLVGCIGFDFDDFDENIENMTNEEFEKWLEKSKTVDIHGVKVLYRPDSYDFDENTRPYGEQDKVNDYYARYSMKMVDYLHKIYNVLAKKAFDEKDGLNSPEVVYPDNETITYVYDTSRYSITNTDKYISDGEEVSFVVTASTQYKWNWSFALDALNIETPLQNPVGNILKKSYVSEETGISDIGYMYNNDIFTSAYSTAYVSADVNAPTEYSLYSPFSKALTYVIYRYALDLEPEQISVTQTNDENYVKILIGGKDLDIALNEAKDLFNKLGSFVGITQSMTDKISNWVLNNVIGSQALNSPDLIQRTYVRNQKVDADGNMLYYDAGGNETTSVTASKVYADRNGNTITENDGYYIDAVTTKDLHRNYANTVKAIISKVNNVVKIGGYKDEEDVDISNGYLASQITEYAANMFMISDDRNFPQSGTPDAKKMTAIPELEYQAVSFMMSKETKVDSIWVALKYDADHSGTKEGVYGDEYIEISLDLNYYSHATGVVTTISSPILKVYDGSYDVDCLTWPGDGKSSSNSSVPADHSSGYVFDGLGLTVGEFNTKIGNKVLMTDVGFGNYQGRPLRSRYPALITGHDNLKNWFEMVEGKSETNDRTYRTGRYNSSRFGGADGCDYLEICYKVYKQPGVQNKNYKFYTGVATFVDE